LYRGDRAPLRPRIERRQRGPGGVGANGGGGSTVGTDTGSCDQLEPVQRRLWRLSVEQYQAAVKDLLGLSNAPQLTNRGGEAQWAFFSDVSLGVDDSFQYALYQAVESVLPNIPAALTACKSGEAPSACAHASRLTSARKPFAAR